MVFQTILLYQFSLNFLVGLGKSMFLGTVFAFQNLSSSFCLRISDKFCMSFATLHLVVEPSGEGQLNIHVCSDLYCGLKDFSDLQEDQSWPLPIVCWVQLLEPHHPIHSLKNKLVLSDLLLCVVKFKRCKSFMIA